MDLIRKARTIERQITRTLGAAARSLVEADRREPLEIAHAIVRAAEHNIQLGGRGRRVFPFDTIAVSVLAVSPEARVRLDAVLVAEPGLRARIAERLGQAGCEPPTLDVRIDYVTRPGKGWSDPDFALALSCEGRPETRLPSPQPARPVAVELTVVRGSALHRTYTFAAARVCLGRGAEVRDSRNRLIRTNDVVFVAEQDAANASVSRQHARVDYEPESRSYRLHDEGSTHGTGIVRDGRTVSVPRGGSGVRLRSGDEIVLGEARLRFKVAAV